MEDYQSNSNKAKEKKKAAEGKERPKELPKPEKKIEKVIKGKVIVKPKPLGTRLMDLVTSFEFKGVARYIGNEILLPAFKNTVYDVMTQGSKRVIFGDDRPSPRYREHEERYAYNKPVNRGMFRDERYDRSPAYAKGRAGRPPAADEIILQTKQDAEDVLDQLIDVIDVYGVVSLYDLYELLGLKGSYVDKNWGWEYLYNVQIRQRPNHGWLIDLPPLEHID